MGNMGHLVSQIMRDWCVSFSKLGGKKTLYRKFRCGNCSFIFSLVSLFIIPSFHLHFSCLLIIAFHYLGLSTISASHISWHFYTIAHHHTFTVSISCCCCLFQHDWLPAFNSGCCFACVHALFLIHFSLNCCRYQTYIHPFLPNITSYIICCNKHLYSIHQYLLLGMKRKYNPGALKCK